MTEKRWLGASLLLALACIAALVSLTASSGASLAAPAAPPAVTGVRPATGPNDLQTSIVITGSGFLDVPTVTLGSTVLDDVGWLSASALTATVPWGLPPGVYTMTVANPGGEAGSLPGAFTVTEGIGVWATGGPYGGRVSLVIVHPVTPTTVYALVRGAGAFVSFDRGNHWQLMLKDSEAFRLSIDAGDPKTLYFSGSSILRSRDGGRTWVDLTLGEPPLGFHPENGCFVGYPVAHPTETGVVYAGTGSCEGIPVLPGEGGVFYSENYGESWVTRTNGLTDTDLVDIAFHPADPDVMATAGHSGDIFTSTDGGLTWHWTADLGGQLRRIYFDPSSSPEAWVVPYAEFQPPSAPYLWKSTNAMLDTWVTAVVTDDLVTGGGIWGLAFSSGTVWAAGDRGYTSGDGGATWQPVMGGQDPINTLLSFAISPDDAETVFAGTEMNGHLRSADGGLTWQERNEGLAGLQLRGLVTPRGDMDTVYANTFERGLLRSDDGGQAWRSLVFFHGGAPKGQRLAADPFDPDRVYYGQSCDNDKPCVHWSADRGLTWQEVELTLPITWAGWNGTVLTVAPHPVLPGRILASAGFCRDTAHCNAGKEPAGFYASDDSGLSWSYLGPSGAISEPLSIAYDLGNADLVYAGTQSAGLWRSMDGGNSWMAIDIPGTEPPVTVDSIAPHPDASESVYVRLYSYGLGPNPQPELYFSEDAGTSWQAVPDVDTVFPGHGGVGLAFMPPTPDSGPYTMYSGCEVGICRAPAGTANWQEVTGAPDLYEKNAMVAASDGQRSRLYLGTPGGTVSLPGRGRILNEDIPGLGSLLGGGVYRYTTLPQDVHQVFLPVVVKD